MKSLKLLLPVCLLMTFILSSCGGGGHKDQILDYLAVKTKKDANKISLLDYEGKIVAEDEFDETSTIIATNGVIYDFNSKTKKLKYWTLSDKKVKPLFDKEFEAGTPYNEDYAVVRDDQGMLSLIDKKGNPSIANLSKLGDYEVLTAGVVSDGLLRFKAADGKWGYANTKGEVVIKPAFNKCENFVNGNARVVTDKDEFQIIDKKGQKTTFKAEEDVKYGPISEKNMVYERKNGEGKEYVGLLDLKGEKIIKDGKYTRAGLLTSGLLAVKNDDSWGVINTKGEVVGDLRFKFESEPSISQTGNVIVRVDKKVKLYNNKGELVIGLDDFDGALPISKDKFIGFRDDKFDIFDDKGKTITKDSYVWAGGGSDDALNAPDIYLNTLSVNSTYFNFENLFKNTIGSITTKDIAGLNENSNIENAIQRFPFVKYDAASNASPGNNYSLEMGTKSKKSNESTPTETSSATAEATTETAMPATEAADKFPGVGSYFYQTYKGASQFLFNFQFNGYVKSYDYDANYNSIPKLDLGSRLSQIDIDFGDKSGNDVFKKKMKAQLISVGWKTTGDDKDSTLYFTNGANGNTISLSGSGLQIAFAQPEQVMPTAETAAPY